MSHYLVMLKCTTLIVIVEEGGEWPHNPVVVLNLLGAEVAVVTALVRVVHWRGTAEFRLATSRVLSLNWGCRLIKRIA